VNDKTTAENKTKQKSPQTKILQFSSCSLALLFRQWVHWDGISQPGQRDLDVMQESLFIHWAIEKSLVRGKQYLPSEEHKKWPSRILLSHYIPRFYNKGLNINSLTQNPLNFKSPDIKTGLLSLAGC
jgi:hypothetical protein